MMTESQKVNCFLAEFFGQKVKRLIVYNVQNSAKIFLAFDDDRITEGKLLLC